MKNDSLLNLEKTKTELNSKVLKKITTENPAIIKKIRITSGENFSNKLQTKYIYFIVTGFVLQYCIDPTGEEKALDICGPNDILGIETMYNNMTTLEQSLALTDIELSAIPVKILKPYFYEFPFFIYNNLQYSMFVQKIDLLGILLPGDQRVLLTIIELLRYLGKNDQGTFVLPAFITHKIIALFASVSRSYVSKIISKLYSEGLLSTRGRLIVCSDVDKLISMSIYFNNDYQ